MSGVPASLRDAHIAASVIRDAVQHVGLRRKTVLAPVLKRREPTLSAASSKSVKSGLGRGSEHLVHTAGEANCEHKVCWRSSTEAVA